MLAAAGTRIGGTVGDGLEGKGMTCPPPCVGGCWAPGLEPIRPKIAPEKNPVATLPAISMTTPTAPLKVASSSRRRTIPSTACATHPPYCRNSCSVSSSHCPASYAAASESNLALFPKVWILGAYSYSKVFF